MTAINTALRKIFEEIPEEILGMGFRREDDFGFSDNRSLEELVMNNVIRDKVFKDINIVGGQEVTVSLEGLEHKIHRDGIVIRVPSSRLNGRDITSVISLETGRYEGGRIPVTESTNPIEGSIRRLAASYGSVGTKASTTVDLVGKNTIYIEGKFIRSVFDLRCVVSHDKYLANINKFNHLTFAELCVVAAKAVLYTKLRLKVNETALRPGSPNGAIREIVDSFSSASQEYNEFLRTRWKKVDWLNDGQKRRNLHGTNLI